MLKYLGFLALFGALVALALVGLCAAGIAYRLRVVVEYRNFAGDGWQYYHLAQNLVGPDHRYAFGPAPQPPAWSRLPGYPIFVAAAGVGAEDRRGLGVGIDRDNIAFGEIKKSRFVSHVSLGAQKTAKFEDRIGCGSCWPVWRPF